MDGGYHVDVLHTRLAGQLDLSSYSTEVFDTFSIQSVRGASSSDGGSTAQPQTAESTMHNADVSDFAERLGEKAMYTFAYPNLAINPSGRVPYLQLQPAAGSTGLSGLVRSAPLPSCRCCLLSGATLMRVV